MKNMVAYLIGSTLFLFVIAKCNKIESKASKPFQPKIKPMELNPIDSIKFQESVLVLKVVKTKDGIGGKYIWDSVKIISQLKNNSNLVLPEEIDIGHYSFKNGLPNEACIVYLTYYPLGAKEVSPKSSRQWILLKGDGDYGVQLITQD